MKRKVVIAGSCRTAIGSMGGSLSSTPVAKLGEVVIKEALKRSGVSPKEVDMVYMGCVLQAGQGQNVARQAAVNAGIPVEVPAMVTNVLCGSGLESVNMAARLIAMGEADVVVAGGMENMSRAPYVLDSARFGYRLGDNKLVDSMVNDGLTDGFEHYHMGITAENVVEKRGLTRQELDEFAAESQRRAVKARAEGRFEEEIVPVEVKVKKELVEFKVDEGPREGTTFEKLSKLRPVFKKDGVVTAGNASTINDGAAALVLMSEEKAKELGVKVEFEWVDGTLVGLDPAIMGEGPIVSTEKLCSRLGIKPTDFDLVEANEAFAAQSVAVVKALGLDPEKVNVNGGAIALGHPIGCSGARILVTLLHEMKKRTETELGLATLCIGGGMGCSTAIKKIK